MGAEANGINDKGIREVERPAGTTGSTESTSTTATSADSRRTGGDGGRTGGKAGGEAEKEEVPRLVVVEKSEDEKREERNRQRRERYAKQKAENGGTVKPRKVNKKKQAEPAIDVTQLNMIVSSLSAVVASRPDCEQWLLTEAEINSITTPLAKMLAESETFSNIGEYSNQIALVMACITVFVPRLIVTVQKQKEKQKNAKSITKSATDIRNKAKDSNADRPNNSRPSTNGKDNGSNEPFYGVSLC